MLLIPSTILRMLCKSGYRPRMADELKSIRLQMVIAPSQVAAIDAWRKEQPDLPSRSEAIRRLIDLGMLKRDA